MKSNEQYVLELKQKNPNIMPLEDYKGANTSILHKCLIDGYEWKARPGNMLFGSGCPKCSQRFRRTDEDYKREVSELYPYIEVLNEFLTMQTPILHRCNRHNIEWMATPQNILDGHGCKQCGIEKIIEKNIKTNEQYIQELSVVNPNIEVLEDYKGANTPILHRCLIDNYEWKGTPANLLYHTGCPRCSKNVKRTQEQYLYDLKEVNPFVIPLEDFINVKTPILHRCLKHNIDWITSPASVLQGGGCKNCKYEKHAKSARKTHKQYVAELSSINSNVIPLENYIDANTPILHKCLIDGYEWTTTPARLLYGGGCPVCNESKGEKRIAKWLDDNKIEYIRQKRFSDCKDKKTLPLDFYLPFYNVCIEYDGKQHFEAINWFGGNEKLEYTQKHDKIKTEYCKENGILLLRIPYFKNIEEELEQFLFI